MAAADYVAAGWKLNEDDEGEEDEETLAPYCAMPQLSGALFFSSFAFLRFP